MLSTGLKAHGPRVLGKTIEPTTRAVDRRLSAFHVHLRSSDVARSMMWKIGFDARKWACSDCGWNYPVPSLLSDPEALSAFDRLARNKFLAHACADHPAQTSPVQSESPTERMRGLVRRGYKPKDAAQIVVQEISLEHGPGTKQARQAEEEAGEFLRRVRDGII
jgi:hypothetical protein